jgi:flagellar protein FlgJ
MSAPPIKDASVYTDVRGLNSLKQAAKTQDPKAVREAARQFESLFTRMMLKSMRQANFKDPNFGSDQSDFYQDMFDDQLAVQMSKGHGLGLADMMVQQMTRAGMLPAAAKNAAAAGATPSPPAIGSTASAASAPANMSAAPGADTSAASAPTPAQDSSSPGTSQADFVKAMWPAAKAAGDALGVDPRNIVAQAALETGWGRAVPADSAGRTSFNLFGIKSGSQWTGPSVGVRTLEYSGGVPTARTDKFRAYSSTDDSFQDYVALLRGNSRYSAALNTGSDTKAFATALQNGGYSTDPAYASKLAAIAQNLDTSATGLKSADARPINPSATIL